MNATITDREFSLFQQLVHQLAGISLSPAKKILLVGRLSKRLSHYGFDSFTDYYQLLTSGKQAEEVQQFVDLMTTNETYFFREPQHFDFLRDEIVRGWPRGAPFRIWSGACSSGEEPYTMAMVLAEHLSHAPWEVFASDISRSMLARAATGIYPLERTEGIPPGFLRKYCLKGVRSQQGKLLVAPVLRERVRFAQLNLTAQIAGVGLFDAIFLRNVMIYFDVETKRKVVENMLPSLKPGGYFIVGHSESLTGLTDRLVSLRPTIYRKET
ncbi:CheR family methyltransferase [Aromatoleum buckelii]|uniref:Chemotaxis protein methyltransferase n=1 Tax=Aromatoleum buckelii TaxID=200254 RepID=A0ABX1N5Y9_9RHOO|nr:protein-glutamate O-methyltransferase CheR [Aromatoleum buckelii]MCK0509622.1 protein-glutamate O-methyltransferase CheR [Aromatoleum buckelii]